MSENETETGSLAEKRPRKPRAPNKPRGDAADAPASAPAAPVAERAPEVRAERAAPAERTAPVAAERQAESRPADGNNGNLNRDEGGQAPRADSGQAMNRDPGGADNGEPREGGQNAGGNPNQNQNQGGEGDSQNRNRHRRDRFRDRDRDRNRGGGGGGGGRPDDGGDQGERDNRPPQGFQQPQLPPDFPSYTLTDLKRMPAHKLLEMAETLGLHEGVARMRKQDVIFALLKVLSRHPNGVAADGVLEILPDGYGFLRSADASYLAGPDDVYISPARSVASTCAPAMKSPAASAARRMASAMLH